ncbi:MAG: universal stress protein [Gammaproteobacteria bacterium]|nr:universal stress protein [Gammaproteobacteria bacterium]MDP6617066.1 universal stress protein [Gammaproteobacteria bacterium]MDP7042385.1 universal stress protein [Gammaproteobacteria bacterium]
MQYRFNGFTGECYVDLYPVSTYGTDIVIVGSHGRGALRQLLVGSISEEVLRHAKCPVIVIPVLGCT